jgi:hypothetical protein
VTASVDINYKNPNSSDKFVVRYIPVHSALKVIIQDYIQTQDVFHIRFYPDNSHLDIKVYEFLDFKDFYYEVRESLCDLNLDPIIKCMILRDLLLIKDAITKTIQYFGVPHFWLLMTIEFDVRGKKLE